MAADKATLKADLKALAAAAVGVDDNFDTWAEEMANAIDAYAQTLTATGTSGVDSLPIS